MKTLFVITGASKGLGRAFAERALQQNYDVVAISRHATGLESPGIKERLFDLQETELIPDLAEEIGQQANSGSYERIVLINNAGILAPVGFAGTIPRSAVTVNLTVNLVAPMVLTGEFLRATTGFQGHRMVINISSGAATNPRPGWSAYSASKAGLQAFSVSLAREQSAGSRVHILCFNPGVMDTDMQVQVRSSRPEDFPEVERFRGLSAEGKLRSPRDVAKALLEYIESDLDPEKTLLSMADILV